MSKQCKWYEPWAGRCPSYIEEDQTYCPEHRTKCCSCGEPATHGCGEYLQFVCGAPLCERCGHAVDGGHAPFKECYSEERQRMADKRVDEVGLRQGINKIREYLRKWPEDRKDVIRSLEETDA